ncbi:methylated-DNA--[protein]-cysteine S-methyltransferase [Candidatus Odyssella thessalonicensis]|uniref:methylated-DNA--[protein]-cysteine S-methyltransferase n=1 Tax=Candidatus Odyssella thessalonicensis TaxID=84647 RepID=UPI000225A90C|nr:methylated-DNA--[protein]-cysteine S-methyltransferase [Candidatus Odyssella thessalonicensis]
MKLIVLDKKSFSAQYPDRQVGRFRFSNYGAVEAEYSGSVLHRLTPSALTPSLPELPQFTSLVVNGTVFQAKVWQALLDIPCGHTRAYSDIAQQIGHPKAMRAVGTAIGANPIGILIPCHRVIAKNGDLGGFAWGIDLKKQWLGLELTKEHP